MNRPRVLAVVHIPIDPDYPNGFSYRLHGFFKALAARAELDFLVLRGIWDDRLPPERMVPTGIPHRRLRMEMIRDRPEFPWPRTWAEKITALWRHFSYRAAIPPGFQRPEHLRELVDNERPDLVVFFFHQTAALVRYFPDDVPCLFILEEGDERQLLTNASFAEDRPPPLYKRLWRHVYWWPRVLRFRALYRELGARGHVIAISEAEKRWFEKAIPASRITVLPNGLDCAHYRPQPGDEEYDIGIFGVFRHRRNYEPAREFFDEMNRRSDRPLRWLFVGQEPHACIRELASDRVTVLADVPDTRPYYGKVKLVVVPAKIGAGAKSTVLKAWAMQRPVLTTRHGTNGLPASSGVNLVAAADTAGMVREALALLDDADLRQQIAIAGRQTVERERNMEPLSADFADLCLKLAS